MGMLKGHVQDWLDDVGYELGYDYDNLPSLTEMDDIKRNNICIECNQWPYSDTDKMCPVCGKIIGKGVNSETN